VARGVTGTKNDFSNSLLDNQTTLGKTMIFEQLKNGEQNPDLTDRPQVDSTSNILTQESFSLLEERLMVDLNRRKIGEIVIRKEIATQFVRVEVPVRREKLIVEQVSPEYELLAEIDLGQVNNSVGAITTAIPDDLKSADDRNHPISTEFDDPTHNLDRRTNQSVVYGSTESLKAAIGLFSEIANLSSQDCGTIRIEIELKDSKYQSSYQALLDRYLD
jgi:hypothetical protein